MTWLHRLIDRCLNCPPDQAGGATAAPTKVRCPTRIHRWWRQRQFARAQAAAIKDGATLLGEWDDWLWINRKEVKAARRTLSVTWSLEAQQDLKQEFP